MLERSVGTQEVKMCAGRINTKPEISPIIKACLLKPELLFTLANRILHMLYGLDQDYLV